MSKRRAVAYIALAGAAAFAIIGVESGARAVSGVASLLGADAWQGSYRQELALEQGADAAELHLATFGWTGAGAITPVICTDEEALRRSPGGVLHEPIGKSAAADGSQPL